MDKTILEENEITTLEQNVLNARAEYVCAVDESRLSDLALKYNLPIEIVEDCHKRENWKMQRTAYLTSASNELNVKTMNKKANENFKSLDLLSILRDKAVQQIIKRIDNEEYDMTVNEAIGLIKSIDTLGKQLETQHVGSGSITNNKILNVNFSKPVEEMSIDELKKNKLKLKSALSVDSEISNEQNK